MRIALAQIDPLVGDLAGNGRQILQACRQAAEQGAELLLTPELSLWGYPPRDLLLRPALIDDQRQALDELVAGLASCCSQLAVLVGFAEPIAASGLASLPNLYNAAALVEASGWRPVARKRLLPNYDVFDERRYFRPGQSPAVLDLVRGGRRWRLGITICEDLWVEEQRLDSQLFGVDQSCSDKSGSNPAIPDQISTNQPGLCQAIPNSPIPDPIGELQPLGIDLLINLSASPFGMGKAALRLQLAASAARRLGCAVLYVNQVGGNDELVFDGASFVLNAAGSLERQLACCRQQLACWDTPTPLPPLAPADALITGAKAAGAPVAGLLTTGPTAAGATAPDEMALGAPAISPVAIPLAIAPSLALPDPQEQLLRALVLGLADYAHKCGFRQALLGLSGGIDSALVAVIAAAALGAHQVQALLMPSPWSSAGSIDDAAALAGRLGIATATLPIAPLMAGFDGALAPALPGGPQGVTAENLQSRIRGTLLMAVANQRGQLLLSTGNKSELAVGYCTLYGDMNGGLAVIGDLYKTTVFSLCEWIDSPAAASCRAELALPSTGELVGLAIRHKPPSAELRPDQLDSDSLPDYAVLDPLLKAYIERHWSLEELIANGSPPELARRVQQLLRRSEFKRRQAAPALKVSGRAFGSGWRMPIAAA
jgi:NAD+ synthase (glutamine-hydrolysing)